MNRAVWTASFSARGSPSRTALTASV
ncbi:hypothetical protein EG834_18335 [bacterium]|nr:hypothetical protein [bacterium]